MKALIAFFGKYFPLLFLAFGGVGLIWGIRGGFHEGAWWMIAPGFGLFLLVGIINKLRGLPWFSDSSAGH